MLNNKIIEELERIVGTGNIITEADKMIDYSHDEFPLETIYKLPEAVVMPGTTQEVSEVLQLANRERFFVTPRGGGTGLCGGAIPSKGGVVLSLERMNRVLELDTKNYFAVAQAGVRLMDFYKEVETKGFFFPPHPGDETAMLGGAIATNAGGARTLKYGVMRNFVKGLEVVLPQGEIIQLGGKLLKNSMGYSLMHLMIGSEGTLGIITKAVIHLLPSSASTVTLIATFEELIDAIDTVPEILRNKIIPMAVEFLERDVVDTAEDFLKRRWPCKGGKAYLMIILDGSSQGEVIDQAEKIGGICMSNKSLEVFIAQQTNQQKEILDFRSQLYETMKKYIIEVLDIVLPPSEIPAHVKEVNAIAKKYNMWLPTFGHASDGNVHTHIMRARFADNKWTPINEKEWRQNYPLVRKAIHEDIQKRGGMVSGEHGIGLIKKEYLDNMLGSVQLELFKRIKTAFDPNTILNPGKIVDI
jgi:glycolate oxidase